MWQECKSCHLEKSIGDGEQVCRPCAERGHAPRPAGPGGLRGADALRQLQDVYMDPSEVRSLAAERERMRYAGQDAAGDVELLSEYARRLGVLLDGVDHRAGCAR